MNPSIEFSQKLSLAYSNACKPLCKELDLPQTAFDILMFLGNNPDCKTASEIVELRHIKANLVSLYVERLVQSFFVPTRQFLSLNMADSFKIHFLKKYSTIPMMK